MEMLERIAWAPGPGQVMIRAPAPRPPARWERIAQLTGEAAVRVQNLRGLGIAFALAITLWMIGVPWVAPWLLGLGLVHFTGAVAVTTARSARAERARGPLALPLAPQVEPREIACSELRATYEDILRLHEDIRCALVEAERMQSCLRGVFERCGAVVHVAGRLARLANPLHRYLEVHGTARVKEELHRLANTADGAADPLARGVYQSAAAARGRQLGTLFEIKNLRDRISARLELITASLESVAALVIKLQVLDLEQIELAGESMSEHLATLGEELAILESSLDEDV